MPDFTDDRLQPCLFDRLIDENPGTTTDSRAERAISTKNYREGVLRDLIWLFNAKAHLETEDISLFGESARSVVNYGIPDLCGRVASSLDMRELERRLVQAIERFEQRILPNTVTVKAVPGGDKTGPNVIAFEIRGELWANPVSEQLYIKTQIDLDTGQCVS